MHNLEKKVNQLKHALAAETNAVVCADAAGLIEWANDAFFLLTGLCADDLPGKEIISVLPLKIKDGPPLQDNHPFIIAVQKQQCVEGVYFFVGHSGAIPVSIRCRFVEDKINSASVIMIIREMYTEAEFEKSRLQSEALNAAANAIVITDDFGMVQWVNPAFTKLTGYMMHEISGKSLRVLKSGKHDAAFYSDLWQTIKKNEIWEGETINKKKDGDLYIEYQTITPITDGSGRITQFIAVKEDITERKKYEKELERYRAGLEKMVTDRTKELISAQSQLINKAMESGMARLSSMILHNIGNAITPAITGIYTLKKKKIISILKYLDQCLDGIHDMYRSDFPDHLDKKALAYFKAAKELVLAIEKEEKGDNDAIERIENSISYISDVITHHQAFAIIDEEIKEIADVSRVIQSALSLHELLKDHSNIRITYNIKKDLPNIIIDKKRLVHVIMSLLQNSFEAFKTSSQNQSECTIHLNAYKKSTHVVIEIMDNGAGYSKEALDAFLEMNRSPENMAGFGFYYCKLFIENNGGIFKIESPILSGSQNADLWDDGMTEKKADPSHVFIHGTRVGIYLPYYVPE